MTEIYKLVFAGHMALSQSVFCLHVIRLSTVGLEQYLDSVPILMCNFLVNQGYPGAAVWDFIRYL